MSTIIFLREIVFGLVLLLFLLGGFTEGLIAQFLKHFNFFLLLKLLVNKLLLPFFLNLIYDLQIFLVEVFFKVVIHN